MRKLSNIRRKSSAIALSGGERHPAAWHINETWHQHGGVAA
jgi:hypothetical protein